MRPHQAIYEALKARRILVRFMRFPDVPYATGGILTGLRISIGTDTEIDALLQENRKFPPSKEFRANALLNDPKVYDQDMEKFWEARANVLEWFSKWKTVPNEKRIGQTTGEITKVQGDL